MSAAKPLLHRQVKLLEYLTSGEAIFRVQRNLSPALQGIDPRLLHLEARFSHEKRMEKILAVFPKTFELLGTAREAAVRAFTDACPPHDISRLENARQFHGFLSAHWQRQPPIPPYLPDVMACEIAFAAGRVSEEQTSRGPEDSKGGRRGAMRRRLNVVLLRTAYDIRPMFDDSSKAAVPLKRDTCLAITHSSRDDQPQIFELASAVFVLLGALGSWTDRAAVDRSPEVHELISDLAGAGLIEVRR
jgi:hypothetical protein